MNSGVPPPLLLALLLSLSLAPARSLSAQLVAPDEARAAAAGYLEYALSRNAGEPGFFRRSFGIDPPAPGKEAIVLGEPYAMFILGGERLRHFVDSEGSDVLSFAEPRGFGFPLVDSERHIVGVITTQQLKGTWVWASLLAGNNPEVIDLRQVRQTVSKEDGSTFASLLIREYGTVALTIQGGRIVRVAPMHPILAGIFNSPLDSTGHYGFTDYEQAEQRLRVHDMARRRAMEEKQD